jgi:hypothetical protein
MNKAELLAELGEACQHVYLPPTLKADHGICKVYQVQTEQVEGLDKIRGVTVTFKVFNEGVVAGPQAYAQDVVDEEGTVIHAAGDPILDEEGEQVVIDAQNAEAAFYMDNRPTLPRDKNEAGMAYLASKVLDGTIAGFELKHRRPDLGIFSFFEVEVVTPGGQAFEVTKETWRVQEGPTGVFHMRVV